MNRFIVEGKKKLSGSITVSGNKNEVLPLIAASLLSSKPVTLSNIPAIGDVKTMCYIAESLGVKIVWEREDTIIIDPKNLSN
ncbi:MAG: hypothetical protein N2053_00375, partial [Chitinispirillaceae bacterium]|nr:hypothetical protein [Chitinispirillaceae bacterium]